MELPLPSKNLPLLASKRLEAHMNRASEFNPAIIAMETDTVETKATPTFYVRKRPHPKDSDESEDIGVLRVSPPHKVSISKTFYQPYSYFHLFLPPKAYCSHVRGRGPDAELRDHWTQVPWEVGGLCLVLSYVVSELSR